MNYYSNEYPSIYRGKVESNIDPKNLGRCKIRIPAVHGELNYPVDLLPWARPVANTPINSTRGSFVIPDVGDIVWVLFEGSNKNYPVYLGGVYSMQDIQILSDKVVIYTEQGNSIVYDRSAETFSISVGNNMITLNKDGISLIGDVKVKGNIEVSGEINSIK